MISTKRVRQPGPVSPIRLESHLGAARSLTFSLEPGLSLNEAIARPLGRAGFTSAAVTLQNLRFKPFRYVIPAHAPDDTHAAYYSDTFAPPDEVELEFATLTFGRRADGPFLHCHAIWRDEAGRLGGGHVLPLDAIISAPAQAEAFGTDQVEMRSDLDPETNFALFRPVGLAAPAPGSDCLVAHIRPNEDLIDSIESLCRHHAITHARVRSGIGSTIGMTFDDGRIIRDHPTELLTLEGHVEPGADGHPSAQLSLAVIDVHGAIHQGRPAPTQNPVLICFELFLQVIDHRKGNNLRSEPLAIITARSPCSRGGSSMKKLTLAFGLALLFGLAQSQQAEAGCLGGAVVGGIAGHMVGHGGVGAAAGCAVGHHRAATRRAASDSTNSNGQQGNTSR